VALLGTVSAKDTGPVVLAEALSDGWCFAAPRSGAHVSVAFYTDRPARGGRAEQAAALAAALAKSRLISRHVDLSSLCYDMAVSAVSAFAEPATGPSWLAVGDAAFAADPLSSSGLAFAAASAIEAARAAETGYHDAYEHFVAQRVAQFRIQRQIVYSTAAQRFRSPFWDAHASLATSPRARSRPTVNRTQDRSDPAV
jgi:flavin-dependent dehydrogenase